MTKSKVRFISFTLLCFFSCSPQIEDDVRTVVRGKVVDNQGNPISKLEIITRSAGLDLGIGNSDNSGNFEFISLRSKDKSFDFIVNPNGNDPKYTTFEMYYLNQPIEDIYELGILEIRLAAVLNLNISKTSTDNVTLKWSLKFAGAACEIYDDPESNFNIENCYESRIITGNNSVTFPNYNNEIRSILGSTALFTYSINDGEEQTISIELNQNQNSYDFEF